MRRLLGWLTVVALALAAVACGGEREKGINRDKDRPRSADKSS